MDRSVLLGALLVLVANVSFSQAQTVQRYIKVGDRLELSPQKVSKTITSVLWYYGPHMLAEWEKGLINQTYYGRYKGRTTLNITTGDLEIRDVTAADTAVYKVMVNNDEQNRVYQVAVIEDVPQPKVEAKPLGCSSASERCSLVCDGDVSKAGPVEYFWKKDDGHWGTSETSNTMEIINDEETRRVKTFTCRMKNPFSEEDGAAFDNRFNYKTKPTNSSVGAIVGGIIGAIALLAAAAAGVAFWKWEYVKPKIPCLNSSPPNPANPPAEGKELMGVNTAN